MTSITIVLSVMYIVSMALITTYSSALFNHVKEGPTRTNNY